MKDLLPRIYELLYEAYGPQFWWPGDTPWEICAGAVLTQNTNWGNVEKAVANLKKNDSMTPERILEMPVQELEKALRPSGYFRLKAVRLRSVAFWWLDNTINDGIDLNAESLAYWRDSLLEVNGIGPETADSILLYSFNQPSFVIDAYTKRIMSRHAGTAPDVRYDDLRSLFMNNLEHDSGLFNEFHALFVRAAKEHCAKKMCSPLCPLRKLHSMGG